jgi:nicotinate phosphoribosyltransferase
MSGAPIDVWGVGTNLVTARGDSHLTGVYKLAAKKNGSSFEPTIKVSNNPSKVTNPGVKQVYRFYDREGSPVADLLTLVDETMTPGKDYRFFHPMIDYKQMTMKEYESFTPLLQLKMNGGRISCELPDIRSIQDHTKRGLQRLDSTYKRLKNPHVYKISLSQKMKIIKDELIRRYSTTDGSGRVDTVE